MMRRSAASSDWRSCRVAWTLPGRAVPPSTGFESPLNRRRTDRAARLSGDLSVRLIQLTRVAAARAGGQAQLSRPFPVSLLGCANSLDQPLRKLRLSVGDRTEKPLDLALLKSKSLDPGPG